MLLSRLSARYGDEPAGEATLPPFRQQRASVERREARRQVALLFSLMEDRQPVEALTGLLAAYEDGAMSTVEIQDGGGGYAEAPKVSFLPPEAQVKEGAAGTKFINATGRSVMEPTGSILRVDLSDHGSGYAKPPAVDISPPKNPSSRGVVTGDDATVAAAAIAANNANIEAVGPRRARAVAILFTKGVNKGKVARIDVVDGGAGYGEEEIITITVDPPESSGSSRFDERETQAVAVPIKELRVKSVEILEAGSGYAAERPHLVSVEPPPLTARMNLKDPLILRGIDGDPDTVSAVADQASGCVGRACYDRNVVALAYARSNRTSYAAARNEGDSAYLEKREAAVEGRDYWGSPGVGMVRAAGEGGSGFAEQLPFWAGERSASARLLALLPSGVGLIFDSKKGRYLLVNSEKDVSLTTAPSSYTNIKPIDPVFGPRGRNPIERQKNLNFYTTLRISAAGAICASCVHLALTPIDVVKTKVQTDPKGYPNPISAFQRVVKEEGLATFFNGWQPTFLGFFVWGGFAYIATEFFRSQIAERIGTAATSLEVPIILSAAGIAAFFGSFIIAPFETVRIRTVAQPEYGNNIFAAGGKIFKDEGIGAFFNSVPVFMLKEIPFACAKFTVFDIASTKLYEMYPAASENLQLSLLVTLTSGTFGGIIAAIVSNPADCTISEMKKASTEISPVGAAAILLETGGLSAFFKGLTLRMVFYSLMVGGQFLLYDTVRFALGVGSDDLKLYLDVLGSAISTNAGR